MFKTILASCALAAIGLTSPALAEEAGNVSFEFAARPIMPDDQSTPRQRQAIATTLENRDWKCPVAFGFRILDSAKKNVIHLHVGCYESASATRRDYLVTMDSAAARHIANGDAAWSTDTVFIGDLPRN